MSVKNFPVSYISFSLDDYSDFVIAYTDGACSANGKAKAKVIFYFLKIIL